MCFLDGRREFVCVFDSNSFYFFEECTECDGFIEWKQKVKKELVFGGALL